jgi:hypothetical protein
MATRTITVCDVCGAPASQQVEFVLDDTVRLDLCKADLAAFRKAVRPFAAKAAQATKPAGRGRKSRAKSASNGVDRAALQRWGLTKGYRIGDRGRIKAEWLDEARAEGVV